MGHLRMVIVVAAILGLVGLRSIGRRRGRGQWLTLSNMFSRDVVTGPNWTVMAPDEGAANEIADALGGET